tara:strand:- start:2688 stop:2861 length:174 start_codon:yes stop_codon:yes gene_type:complete
MLKKIYKKNGIIIVENGKGDMNKETTLYYYIVLNFKKCYTFSEYIKDYYRLYNGFTY